MRADTCRNAWIYWQCNYSC